MGYNVVLVLNQIQTVQKREHDLQLGQKNYKGKTHLITNSVFLE